MEENLQATDSFNFKEHGHDQEFRTGWYCIGKSGKYIYLLFSDIMVAMDENGEPKNYIDRKEIA